MDKKYFPIMEFLELGDEIRNVLKQGNPQVDGSFTSAGEMLEDWLSCLPNDVKKHMARTNPKFATLFKEMG
jgi:hypothetical protein